MQPDDDDESRSDEIDSSGVQEDPRKQSNPANLSTIKSESDLRIKVPSRSPAKADYRSGVP